MHVAATLLDYHTPGPWTCAVAIGTEHHDQVNRWLEFHGIDPHDVVRPSLIARDAWCCQIETRQYDRDSAGRLQLDPDGEFGDVLTKLVTTQGEAPPLPFPTHPDLEAWRDLRHAKRPRGR